jgi:hypothetical protein
LAVTILERTTSHEKALAQIREKRYEERLREDGREKILAYGVAFYKKRCMVKVQEI